MKGRKWARTGLARVERLLDLWQQVGHIAARVLDEVWLRRRKPLVPERLFGGRSRRGVDGKTLADKVLGGVGDVGPVFLYKSSINILYANLITFNIPGSNL